ncbi:hypothetical protein BDV96DRAFT_406881 [Lophiotrema nucula]|uniref:Zn(2)-C6 fungal-type domain-containing protein n=1 Tax=Lophiotrema nucula TaxID=690887 RepID=A0A6A5ZEQ7_9PLEO|nr:hypothetical protein BDV96DRAFT_406881 [Lophiotrema nucula]
MDSRGEQLDKRTKNRPEIARRSCDQCRARKVGCDRKSPCSNCTTARVSCTHSTVASNTAPKQRILISAQYERKIDDIANDVSSIKRLIQDHDTSSGGKRVQTKPSLITQTNIHESPNPLAEYKSISASNGLPVWDYSSHLIDFVKAVLDERTSNDVAPETNGILLSLTKLVHALENPSVARSSPVRAASTPSMPPLDAVVEVLRWAKEHSNFSTIVWISQILPLQTFTDTCRKVYFAVDDYTDVDLILANAYLSCIFSEHVIASGQRSYKAFAQLCRTNLEYGLARLPLLLPASMEVIAALMLGAFNAVENSKATVAWTYVSTAINLCQILGYHRPRSERNIDQARRKAEERLFWTIYGIEKGLSLRLGRSSNIRDSEITLPIQSDEPRSTRLGRIHGMVYDQLYSPASLDRPVAERTRAVESLAQSMRLLINDTHAEVVDATSIQSNDEPDLMQAMLPKCDLVCETSLLALILRARPATAGFMGGISDDCVIAAREALEMHEQCMNHLKALGNDMIVTYVNWAIIYCPFVPFSILFNRAVQLWDIDDLARLDRFADSLRPEASPDDAITHPYRLYKLLCQATRLYLNIDATSWPTDSTLLTDTPAPWMSGDFTKAGLQDGTMDASALPSQGLYDWWQDSQQFMGLLVGDTMF